MSVPSPENPDQPIHLCIGAPRSGASWVFNTLREQDSVFAPAVKEVRYWFSQRSAQQRDHSARLAEGALDGLHDGGLQRDWIDRWRAIDPRDAPDSETYRALMSVAGKPSIDVSPAYCFMPKRLIPQVYEAVPESSKVLFILRDPMARMMSQMKLHWYMHGKYRGLASLARHREFVADTLQLRRADYRTTIEDWRAVFGDRFRVAHYEDMCRAPRRFLTDMCDFLGVELDEAVAEATLAKGGVANGSAAPTPGPAERQIVAEAVLPMIQRYGEIDPEPVRRWLTPVEAAINGVVPPRTVIEDCTLKVQDLMRMTESLGDNCEYGFWQRHRRYEPSSLFRWAITPATALATYLKSPTTDLFDEAALTVHSPGMVDDATLGFKFHSKLVEPDGSGGFRLLADRAQWADVYRQEKDKIDHLAQKFRTQMSSRPAVYVLKCNLGIDRELVEEIRDLVVGFNPNHWILWVEQGAEAGRIEEVGPNLLRGEIDAFAKYTAADQYSANGWTTLMHALAEREDIAKMITAMAS